MKLTRRDDGIVLLDGTPVREWFEANRIVPVQNSYRGNQDGHCVMCLLTALAYNTLEGDAVKLHTIMDRIGSQRAAWVGEGENLVYVGDEPDPSYQRMEVILADVIGLDRPTARDLEAGWTGDQLGHALLVARNQNTELWNLGFDAWEQVKDLTFPRVTDEV